MRALGAEPANRPVRLAAAGAAVHDIEVIERLVAPLDAMIAQCGGRLVDE